MFGIFSTLKDGYKIQKSIIDGTISEFTPDRADHCFRHQGIELSSNLQNTLNEVAYLVSTKQFDAATGLVEKAYLRNTEVTTGLYEHEVLLEPILAACGTSDESVVAAEAAAIRLADWYAVADENPFAAALLFRALHHVGFAHRGTDWADNVSKEDFAKLHQYTDRAIDVMNISAAQHKTHWFWRMSLLSLSISDYRGAKDHWLRFGLARQAQPYSIDVWTTFAHQLLPRWYGEDGDLSRLCELAWNETKDQCGDAIYFELLNMINIFEENDHEVEVLPAVAEFHISNAVSNGNDADLTCLASMHAELGDYRTAFDVLQSVNQIYMEHWHHREMPEWVVASVLYDRKKAA